MIAKLGGRGEPGDGRRLAAISFLHLARLIFLSDSREHEAIDSEYRYFDWFDVFSIVCARSDVGHGPTSLQRDVMVTCALRMVILWRCS